MASIFFSDIPLNFIPNPVTGDIRPVTNENSVKSSLINLLRTSFGERPYRPDFGIDISRYLFEQADQFTEMDINEEIASVLKTYEPRINLVAIETDMQEHSIEITIEYSVVNVPGIQTLNTTIDRIK